MSALPHPTERLEGRAAAVVALREQIRRLAGFDAVGGQVPPVLLVGETGTGKEAGGADHPAGRECLHDPSAGLTGPPGDQLEVRIAVATCRAPPVPLAARDRMVELDLLSSTP